MRNLINSFGGRKFLLTTSVLLGVVACVVTGTSVDPDLLSLVKWVCGLYFAGNVAQKRLVNTTEPEKETAGSN